MYASLELGRKEESKSDSEVEFQPQASRCREGPSPKHIRIVLCAGMGAGWHCQ